MGFFLVLFRFFLFICCWVFFGFLVGIFVGFTILFYCVLLLLLFICCLSFVLIINFKKSTLFI